MKKRIKIKVGFPFFAITAFLLSGELCKNYLYALVFSFLHEIGHLLSMLYFKVYPDSIIFGISGIKICKRELCLSPLQECVTALCGPFVNFIFMFIFSYDILSIPFIINTGLAVFNLLPLKSLDGGRFIYNIILYFRDHTAAERVLVYSETITLVLLVFLLVCSLIQGIANTTFILFVMLLSFSAVTDILKG